MWRHVDLVYSFLLLVFIATFCSEVWAQGNADGPSNTRPEECIARRYWWTSMWGFIVTFIVLTMDVWGTNKASFNDTIKNVLVTLIMSAFNPLFEVWDMLDKTFYGMAMLPNLREALGDQIVAPMYPWSKSHIKIIMGCEVIVNFLPDVHRHNHSLMAFEDEVAVQDLSEALVIGTKVADLERSNVQLSNHGKLASLRANVLPPYDELKFIRGNSSLGMAVASVQAVGYIYGIVVRCVQGLQVSPIEAIACALNIEILMKGFLHNFASFGHRPLLLYLHSEDEGKFIEECKNINGFDFIIAKRLYLVASIAYGIVLAVGAYFIVNFSRSLNRVCVVPIILFEVSVLVGGIACFLEPSLFFKDLVNFLLILTLLAMLLNLVGYVWALVVTFKYWKGEDFDVQSSNYLSQVLPYIG